MAATTAERCQKYCQRLRQRAYSLFGGHCCRCYSKEHLEFAHLEPTRTHGKGRGMKKRFLDVIKNPTKYRLMCHWCHKHHPPGFFRMKGRFFLRRKEAV